MASQPERRSNDEYMKRLDEISHKVNDMWYLVTGNGEPGLCENVRSLDKRMNNIEKSIRNRRDFLSQHIVAPVVTAIIMAVLTFFGMQQMGQNNEKVIKQTVEAAVIDSIGAQYAP